MNQTPKQRKGTKIMQAQYSGVDWITATSRDDKVGTRWYQMLQNERKVSNVIPEPYRQWHNGYYGGIAIDGMKFGYSAVQGYILIVSGWRANLLFHKLQLRPKRVTRLDLCCDVLLKTPSALAETQYQEVKANPNKDKRIKYTYYENTRQGSTMYVGSRSSEQYGRLYDKGVESGLAEPGLYWRYEVELKKPVSMAVAESLWGLTADDRTEAIIGTVKNWFVERNIEAAGQIISTTDLPITTMYRETTVDRKLAWLNSQVSPTVKMLLEAGLGRQVAVSLFPDPSDIQEMLRQAKDLLVLADDIELE